MSALFRSSWAARDLMAHVFPEPRFAVPGLVAEGLNLLAGAPKLGKSWLALSIAAAVAQGGVALGSVPVERGEVLYLALEDPPRRLQRRLEVVLRNDDVPDGLYFETAWPMLLDGGAEKLDAWLGEHPQCRLVVIDVLAKVRGIADGNANRYDADYAAMTVLKTIADAHAVAIVVVHHVRKASADDFVDAVSGTNGLAGAADAVLVLVRSRSSADAVLHVTGRDIEEAEYALRFDTGVWQLLDGPAEDYLLGATRRAILTFLREEGQGSPKSIADGVGLDRELVRKTLQRMVHDEQVAADGYGLYKTLSQPSQLSQQEGQEGQLGQLFDGEGS